MKKIGLISLLTLLVSVIMIGCGGNSKQDPLPPIIVSPYAFINASTPVEIKESSTDYNLSVQLTDNGLGFPGQTINMIPFEVKYGIVDPAEVETDGGGWAHFNYLSPENVDELSGQSATIQAIYDDGNGSVLIQDFVLNFVTPIDNGYHLSNQTKSINVEINMGDANSTAKPVKNSYIISAYVVDEDNLGVKDETVSISVLDADFGYITPGTDKTDEDGRVEFTYNVSDNIADMVGRSTQVDIVYIHNGTESKSPVTINVVRSSSPVPPGPTPPPGSKYQLTNQSTPIVVDENSAFELVSAYVVDANNIGVEGETVTVGMLEFKYGEFILTSAETDETGKASFFYYGPDDITSLVGTSTSFNLNYTAQGVTQSLPVTLDFVQP